MNGGAVDLYGVIGHPVAHSFSPRIHRIFAARTAQHMNYVLVDAAPGEFAEAVEAFRARGGKGLNVTLPFKERAFTMASRLTERARVAGAVNTLSWVDDVLRGDNTDGAGLIRDLRTNLDLVLEGAHVLLAGAGGAASGVIGPLLDSGVDGIVVANRTPERAAALIDRFGAPSRLSAASFDDLTGPFDLIVNATSAGLRDQVPPIPQRAVGSGTFCYDMMYADEPTAFIRWARSSGAARSADGLGMLVEQAAESFLLWRGIRPETGPVLAELRGKLS